MNSYALRKADMYVAIGLLVSILAWTVGLNLFLNTANAANVTFFKDTLSSSDLGVASNHTLQYMAPGGVPAGGRVVLTFNASFTIPSTLDFADIDFAINGVDQTLASTPSGSTWGVTVSTSSKTITILSGTATVPSNATNTIEVGTNATFGVAGVDQITNPNPAGPTSYDISVSDQDASQAVIDSGTTRVAIISSVLVTASVDTTLTFTVAGLATSTLVNGVTTTGATTATNISFGTLAPGVPKVLGQQLSVTTNARNGFVVTLQQNQNLLSSTGADIDRFANDNATSSPSPWTSPAGTLDQENTYGHCGETTDDADLSTDTGSANDSFGSATFVGNISNPRIFMAHNSPSDGTTQNAGLAKVAIKCEVMALQEAGTDYTQRLTWVATPTF